MSLDAITHVWKHSTQKGSALLMMLALADYADENGECWPSLTTLARKARMGKRNVQKILDRLEAAGDITTLPGEGGNTRTGKTNRYRINMQGVNASTSLEKQGMNGATPVGVSHSSTLRGVPQFHQNPNTTTTMGTQKKKQKKKKAFPSKKKKPALPAKPNGEESGMPAAPDEPPILSLDELAANATWIEEQLEQVRKLKCSSRQKVKRNDIPRTA